MAVDIKGEKINRKLSPLVEESVNRQVDERGKCEQIRKNDFNLCTSTCPYHLARLGTSLRVRGKLTLRKKEIIVFIIYKHAFSINLCRILL